jgi:hypothetical protein
MSNLVLETLTTHLPAKRKTTPSGWTSFNAPCCHHNGTTQDKRARGGLITNGDGGVSFHCFNCGFKASYQKGRKLSRKMRSLLQWLGASDTTITSLALQVLEFNKVGGFIEPIVNLPEFKSVELPADAKPITWYDDHSNDNLAKVLDYMKSRQLNIEDYNFHWSPNLGYRDRLIIPFYYKGDVVGWTARKITKGNPKYLSEQQPGYIFNLDAQDYRRLFVIVVEGPLDAIGVDGCALMGSEVRDQQALLLNSLNKQVILVPDRDINGQNLTDKAMELGWSVSMPEWENDVKDVNDAIQKYGRMFTLHTIVSYAEENELKIKLRSKKWFG